MTDPTKMQLEIVKEARKRGMDPSNLSRAQYRAIQASIALRNPVRGVADGGKAVLSRVNTTVGLLVVSNARAAANRRICRQCPAGQFRVLSVKEDRTAEACDACTCNDKFLKSKWKDGVVGVCPLGYWDNRWTEQQLRDRLDKLEEENPAARGMVEQARRILDSDR